jgi:hypothetical protein
MTSVRTMLVYHSIACNPGVSGADVISFLHTGLFDKIPCRQKQSIAAPLRNQPSMSEQECLSILNDLLTRHWIIRVPSASDSSNKMLDTFAITSALREHQSRCRMACKDRASFMTMTDVVNSLYQVCESTGDKECELYHSIVALLSVCPLEATMHNVHTALLSAYASNTEFVLQPTSKNDSSSPTTSLLVATTPCTSAMATLCPRFIPSDTAMQRSSPVRVRAQSH